MPGKTVAKKLDLLFIGLLTLLAFALRLYQLGTPSLWYDELLQLDVAQSPFWRIGPQLVRHAAMPLDYYLLHGWIQLGRQDAWVRFPALFFGVLAVPLIYMLAARLFNRRVGYLAAILLTGASFSVRYSQEVRPYALLLLLTMFSYLGLWQAYKTGRYKYWVWAISGLVGAALAHYFTLFLLLPIGLFVGYQQLLHWRHKKFWQHTFCFGLAIVALLVVFAFNGRLNDLRNVGDRFSTVINQPETLTLPSTEKPNKGSGPPQDIKFFTDNVLIPLATVDPIILLIYNFFVILAFLSLTLVKLQQRWAIFLLINWLFWPIILIYFFLLQRGTFFAVRYILYTLPAYLILVAYGIDTLAATLLARPREQVRRTGVQWLYLSIPALLVTPLLYGELNELTTSFAVDAREDWRAVGQMLQANADSADAVIAVNAEPTINWYYPPARASFGLYNRSEPIWKALKTHQRRWFVLSSYSFKRDEGLRQWLKEHQAVTIAIDRRVVVYIQQEGLTAADLLAQVQKFILPQKALTYATLADQLSQHGDVATSRAFYQRAIELAETPLQKIGYQDRLAALPLSQ